MDDLYDEWAGFPSVNVSPGIPIDFDWGNVDFGAGDLYSGTIDLGSLADFGFDLSGDLGTANLDLGDLAGWGADVGLGTSGTAGFFDAMDEVGQGTTGITGISGFAEAADEVGGSGSGTYIPGIAGFAEAADEVGGAGGYNQEDINNQFWKNLIGAGTAVPGGGVITTDKNGNTVIKYDDGTTKIIDTTKDDTTLTKKDDTITKKDDLKEILKKFAPSKDNAMLYALLGGLLGLLSKGSAPKLPVGYQGGIPKYTATRVPGRGVEYTRAAQGGLMGLAAGGSARPARYLRGGTDGMADKIQTDIDGKKPARLSSGEFVIPADIVGALGSGNSEAGAEVLYDMMDRVRKHAYGHTKQIKQANPKKVLPA